MARLRPALAAGAFLCLLAGLASADRLHDSLKDKLSQPFLKNADWVLSLDKAEAKAKETGKPIFAYFSRSYAP